MAIYNAQSPQPFGSDWEGLRSKKEAGAGGMTMLTAWQREKDERDLIEAALWLNACMDEFDADLSCCSEYLEALLDRCGRVRPNWVWFDEPHQDRPVQKSRV